MAASASASAVPTKPIRESAGKIKEELEVFNRGNHKTKHIHVKAAIVHDNPSLPPKPLFIVTPVEEGTYPLILFFHGTCLTTTSYSQLFDFISSHGFIIVSPQLYTLFPPEGNKEINLASEVTNWLPQHLSSKLPDNITPDFTNFILSGHSRGGRTAFALPLKPYATDPPLSPHIKFSALVAMDPVAFFEFLILEFPTTDLDPPILSNNFEFKFPVTVFGSGLGGHGLVPCAAKDANYEQFYERTSKYSKARFDVTCYGHMDVLDDDPSDLESKLLSKCMCVNANYKEYVRDDMRRCVGGISVAFLKDIKDGKVISGGDFMKIVDGTSPAPAQLDKVHFDQE